VQGQTIPTSSGVVDGGPGSEPVRPAL